MSIYISLLLFLLFYGISPYWDSLKLTKRKRRLYFLFVILVLVIGLRNPLYWIDTAAYVSSFIDSKTLYTFSFSEQSALYTEKGYFLLCVFIRTLTSNTFVYLTIIGLLSMSFLFKSVRQLSILPFLSLCIYIPRYMLSRDMNQMRAGLAISILMAFTYLLYYKKYKDDFKYIVVCWIGSFIHLSLLAAIPIVLLNHLRINKKIIYLGILSAFFFSAFFKEQILDLVSQTEFIKEMAYDYVNKEGGSEKAYANDLTNPMIYYQCLILFVYTYMEEKLAPLSRYYYIFRNGYFMSTIILIVLCQYAILAGRVSTLFATYEIFMIPIIIKGIPNQYKVVSYLALIAPLLVFFVYNIH